MRYAVPLLFACALSGCSLLDNPAAIADAGAAIAAGRAACATGMSGYPHPPDLSRLNWQARLRGEQWDVYTLPPQYTVAVRKKSGKTGECGVIVQDYREH